MSKLSSRTLVLVPFLVLALCACAGRFGTAPSPLDTRLTIRLGDTVEVYHRDLAVRFDRLVEDSRCPADANCVWAGRAVVDLTVFTSFRTGSLRLSTESGHRADTTDGVLVELVSVDPYPWVARPIPRDEYRVTVQVRRNRNY